MNGKIAIVTGGARGIGLGIATCLARKGVKPVLADTDLAAAQAAAAPLGGMGVACDITQRPQVDALVQATLAKYGQIDILVNNAGICPFQDIMQMSEATFKRTLDVNVTGAFHCTQLVAREMIARKTKGRIVFITSLAVNVTSSAQGDYAASKAGLHMLMKSFAIALGPNGITCNAVAPGIILTDMGRAHWEKPENAAFIKQRVPVGRIGSPEDIGNAVALLCADESTYINGVGLIVDGGHQAVCA